MENHEDVEALIEMVEEQIQPETLYPWQKELLRQLLQADDDLVILPPTSRRGTWLTS